MTDLAGGLWSKNGGPATNLPFMDRMPDGTVYTDLLNNPESRELLGWVLVSPPVEELPLEIPMHKARKALRMLGPEGEVFDQDDPSWMEMLEAIIEQIPNKITRGSLIDELTTAPNMVLAGDNTQLMKNTLGMSEAQFEAVARLAITLP